MLGHYSSHSSLACLCYKLCRLYAGTEIVQYEMTLYRIISFHVLIFRHKGRSILGLNIAPPTYIGAMKVKLHEFLSGEPVYSLRGFPPCYEIGRGLNGKPPYHSRRF
jgi:hypothetical protein